MKITSNPYAKKSNTKDYATYFNLFFHYAERFSAQPSIYEIDSPVKDSTFENLDRIGAKRIFSCELERNSCGNKNVSSMEVCYEFEDSMIFFHRKLSLIDRLGDYMEDRGDWDSSGEDDLYVYKCKILFQTSEILEKLKSEIEFEPEKKKHSNVYLLCSMDGMLTLQRFDIKLPQESIDLELNYGAVAAEKFDKVTDCLSKNKSGLVLFSGDPGTGKSTFIKYLTTKTTRKVIYLSSAAIEQLTNPDFLSFIMGHRNSILLLEDAEKVLRSRETQDNDAISNILNITDGILGDCLNIMVVATFNIDREKIDSALVRKGRLLVEHHFKALPAEQCNKIFDSLGSGRTTDDQMTLAEIYNDEENGFTVEEKRRVGF
jgi:adenosyl cobinamide kinase/adenosyl cobinamide phosphate guanylyltransferase